MPIISIIQQPGSNSAVKVVPAYTPIVFLIKAKRTDGNRIPPVVYCDIYLNGIYYKTQSATQFDKLNTENSDWKFNVSDACQEFLKGQIAPHSGSGIFNPFHPIASVFCRFRSSGYDSNGFLLPEDIQPVQGTGSTVAVSGTGTESESFHVLYAVLQKEDNPDLLTHLEHSRPNTIYEASTYPLTHRPNNYRLCSGDNDYFPFLHLGNKLFRKMCVSYRLKGQSGFTTVCYFIPAICTSAVSNIDPTVLDNNDTEVAFDTSGNATQWEWSIDAGTSWNVTNSQTFTIPFDQLLTYLITESGLPIVTENGVLIVPDNINIYQEYAGLLRPRCSNGAYGDQEPFSFTIAPPVVCQAPLAFLLNTFSYPDKFIRFDLLLPGVDQTAFRLIWRFDYGNGFITQPVEVDMVLSGINSFVWNVPDGMSDGNFIFQVKTKCSSTSFSDPSGELIVPWIPPSSNINITIIDIQEGGGSYQVTAHLSNTSTSLITVYGWFMGQNVDGDVTTFNFTVNIPAGNNTGIALISGTFPGANASNATITSASPDPTADGKDLIY